jgi:hypothetical protein
MVRLSALPTKCPGVSDLLPSKHQVRRPLHWMPNPKWIKIKLNLNNGKHSHLCPLKGNFVDDILLLVSTKLFGLA